jgi:hypothetical protein
MKKEYIYAQTHIYKTQDPEKQYSFVPEVSEWLGGGGDIFDMLRSPW